MAERNEQWHTNVSRDTVNSIKEEIITNCTLEYDPACNNISNSNVDDDNNKLNNIKEEFITPHLENDDAIENDHANENDNANENDYQNVNDCANENDYRNDLEHTEKSSHDITEAVSNRLVMHLESITGQSDFSKNADIKMEQFDNVNEEYPSIDDRSMDSDEARALNNVEACLQDDIDIKHEVDEAKEDLERVIKTELDVTITETNLISNKIINTTSTITSPQVGIIQAETTNMLVMEIHPMVHGAKIPMAHNPEAILPTNSTDTSLYEECFQLNSITGNVLSLEQQAYGLLKEGHCVFEDKRYNCEKCPKSYTKINSFREHMKVHGSIERRAMGVLKGLETKKANIEKRLYGVTKKVKKIDIHALKKRMERSERAEKRTNMKDPSYKNKSILMKERKEKLENMKKEREEQIINIKKELDERSGEQKEGHKCICGKIFKRKTSLLACLRTHEVSTDTDSFQCISCNKQFKDKDELAAHRRRLHRKRFPCKFCPTDHSTRKELFKHLQIHQKVQLMEYKVISEFVKGKQKIRCFMCSKSFSQLSELKYHVMDDHREPYICPHCNGTFAKILDFGNHTKAFHPEVEGQSVLDVLEAFSKLIQAWKCEECNEQFHEADKFAMHQIEKHSPDVKDRDQYQCEDCRRVFISQKGLTSHKRIHENNTESIEESEPQEKGVMCVECRKICRDMTALSSHMRLHSPERKYPCKFCDFRFATPEKRKAHSEIHTGDMKYVCFICEYQCSSEHRLEHHKMSIKHANMKQYLLTGKNLIEEETSSKKRESKEDREVKKKREHKQRAEEPGCSKEEATVICDVCGDMFSSTKEMFQHKQTHPFIEFPNEDTPTRIFFK